MFVQDLVCGSFSGVVNVCTGHPFDSIKVRMQMSNSGRKNVTMRAIIAETFRHEGPRGFYKGMSAPLVTVPVVNSVIFAGYEFSKRAMGVRSEADFTFGQAICAGAFAGSLNCVIVGPIELVKCRLQL